MDADLKKKLDTIEKKLDALADKMEELEIGALATDQVSGSGSKLDEILKWVRSQGTA